MRKKIRNPKEHRRRRRHMSIRNRVSGTAERPRACVFRSKNHIYAQVIDDTQGTTIVSVSSLKVDMKKIKAPKGSAQDDGGKKSKKSAQDDGGKKRKKKSAPVSRGILQAREVGRMLADAANEKGVSKVVFDRGGCLYHGRVAALADSARENGLEF